MNFKKNEKAYNSEGSEVLKLLKESENDPREPGNKLANKLCTPVLFSQLQVYIEKEKNNLNACVSQFFFVVEKFNIAFANSDLTFYPDIYVFFIQHITFSSHFPSQFAIVLRIYRLSHERRRKVL